MVKLSSVWDFSRTSPSSPSSSANPTSETLTRTKSVTFVSAMASEKSARPSK